MISEPTEIQSIIASILNHSSGMRRYDAYKNSGVNWIGEIPSHWERVRIKNIVSIKICDGPHETPEWKEEGIPFISAEAIRENIIDLNYKRGYISIEQHSEYCKKSKVLSGDILFCKSGSTTGKSALVNTTEEFGIWSPLAIIRANKNKINNVFIFQSMQTDWFRRQVETSWTFGTQPNIGMGALENLWLALPPLEEQIIIAKYLYHKTSQLDTLISKKQKLIELLQEERTAIINQAVTKGLDPNVPMKDSGIEWLGDIPDHWEVRKLRYVVHSIKTGNTPPSDVNEYFDPEEIDWFTPGDFKQLILADSKRKISRKAIEDGKSKIFPQHSVLLIGIGATLGKIGILLIPASSNQQINAIIFDEQLIIPFFGAHFLNSFSEIIVSMSSSATLAILNQSQTKDLFIVRPPLVEQKFICEYIEQQETRIKAIISKCQQEIELLKEYKTALILEVVTGKIDVRHEILN